jgi:hypothetical protein
MADSPLKFLKFRIGQIKINIEYTNVHVSVQLSDLQVNFLPPHKFFTGRSAHM